MEDSVQPAGKKNTIGNGDNNDKKCFMGIYRCIIKWLPGSAKENMLFLFTVGGKIQQYNCLDHR